MVYYSCLLLYNIIALCGCFLLSPLLILIVLSKKKYRGRIINRLGFLNNFYRPKEPGQKTIWVHTLSVGETTSALPLLKKIKTSFPDAHLILTVTTKSGQTLAHEQATALVDHIAAAPLDLLPSVLLFLKNIKPDLFILVETDFWPNWLFLLKTNKTPSILVNGRISKDSLTKYQRFSLLFTPLFDNFSALAMQSAQDCEKMIHLGLKKEKLFKLGNLKFDTQGLSNVNKYDEGLSRNRLGIPMDSQVWICGSTHAGEEQIIFSVFQKLQVKFPDLKLIIAPRKIERSQEILSLVANTTYTALQKSTLPKNTPWQILILDTLGELANIYQVADVSFIGGSLVNKGGHNPLEAASWGIPVIFGYNMDDFAEIASEMQEKGGAIQVKSENQLLNEMTALLENDAKRIEIGFLAQEWISKNRGVADNHIQLLYNYL